MSLLLALQSADVVAPVTAFVSETVTKVSAISGFTTTTVSWTTNEDAAVWQIREVNAVDTPINSAGVIVASGTNALAGVTQTTDIIYSSLSSGDGAKLLKIFAQDPSGNWSA